MSVRITSEQSKTTYRLTDCNTAPFRYGVTITEGRDVVKIGYIQLSDECDILSLDILPIQWDGNFAVARGDNIEWALDQLYELYLKEGSAGGHHES